MLSVLTGAKHNIGATEDLKVACENSDDEARLKFYCETEKNGYVIESENNVKVTAKSVSFSTPKLLIENLYPVRLCR